MSRWTQAMDAGWVARLDGKPRQPPPDWPQRERVEWGRGWDEAEAEEMAARV